MANDKFTVVGTNIAEKATMIWNVADMYGIDTDTLYEYVTSDRQVMYYRNNHNGR